VNRIDKIKKSFLRILLPIHCQDKSVKIVLYKWLLIGLLIRLTFMPFTLHSDIISVYWRAYLAISHKIPWLSGTEGFVRLLHIFFLWVFRPLISYFSVISNIQTIPTSCSPAMFYIFVNNSMVFRTLFLFKLPYLFFDLSCAFLLLKIFKDNKNKLYAFKFWMVNPIIIFAVYIFGRYESVAIFFILLSLYYAKNNLSVRSVLCLGVSIIIRFYPLILLPFFVIILGKRFREYLKLTLLGLLPLGLITVLNKLFYQSNTVERLTEMYHSNYLLGMKFDLGYAFDTIYIFVAVYAFLLLVFYFKTNHSFEDLKKSNLILLLIFFATCFFHPHYFMWLIPFLTFQVVKDKKFVSFFILQVLCLIVCTFHFKEPLAGYLFAPLNPSYFMHLSSPFKIISKYYSAYRFINIFRSIFSGISLAMAYLVFRELSESRKEKKI